MGLQSSAQLNAELIIASLIKFMSSKHPNIILTFSSDFYRKNPQVGNDMHI